MNKPLKLSSSTHRILACSDLHLQHNPNWVGTPPLWSSRGFKSIGEQDAWAKDQWFKEVDDQTVVIDLGDRTFSDPKGERFRQTCWWPGRQLHVWGNHRSGAAQIYREGIADLFSVFGPHPLESDPGKWSLYPITVGNLTFVGDQLHVFIDGQSVYMQHYAPYLWPEIGAGGMALCGHSHGRCLELNPENVAFHGKICDVSVDNAIAHHDGLFFSWDQIKSIMAAKPIVKRDHH